MFSHRKRNLLILLILLNVVLWFNHILSTGIPFIVELKETLRIISVIFTIIVATLILYEYFTRPKFLVGVLPRKDIKNYFDTSNIFDEVRFNKKFLAKKIINIPNSKIALNQIKKKCSKVFEISDQFLELFVILQNIGERVAKDYLFIITIANEENSNIEIFDIQTENLILDGLDVSDIIEKDDSITKKFNTILPGKKILEQYQKMGLTQRYIRFFDTIESQGFEMIYLKIKVPKNLTDFFVIYRIDCPGIFYSRKLFAENIKINWANN